MGAGLAAPAAWAAAGDALCVGPGVLAATLVASAAGAGDGWSAVGATGAGVPVCGAAFETGKTGAGLLGAEVGGLFVGGTVGPMVGGAFNAAIGSADGTLTGTAAIVCCGRGKRTASVGTGLGAVDASGIGFRLEGACGTILASS